MNHVGYNARQRAEAFLRTVGKWEEEKDERSDPRTSPQHKAFVEVNELGTEATAATAVEMSLKGIPMTPPEFKVNRPFSFMIVDKPSGAILFLGEVENPQI